MSRVQNRDSVAELAVRRRLWALGLRFRVRMPLPGRPDIVFTRHKLAIFIDGDFWHGNAWRVRGLPSFEAQFTNRSQWWIEKIRRNMERDQQVNRQLHELGWRVERVWESDVLAAPDEVVAKLAGIVRPGVAFGAAWLPTRLERRRYHSVTVKEYRESYSVTTDPERHV